MAGKPQSGEKNDQAVPINFGANDTSQLHHPRVDIQVYPPPVLAHATGAAQLAQNTTAPTYHPTHFAPSLYTSQPGLSLSLAQTMSVIQPVSQQHGIYPAIGTHLLASTDQLLFSQPSIFLGVPTQASTVPTSSSYYRILYLHRDEQHVSSYQCLVRMQIELFEVTQSELGDTSQGRNRPIVLKQIGIRCKYCGRKPAQQRAKGAVFFPSQLVGLYQTAQNLANMHLLVDCFEIPKSIREDLARVRSKEKGSKTRKSAYGGGRNYWAYCLRVLGVVETPDKRLMLQRSMKDC